MVSSTKWINVSYQGFQIPILISWGEKNKRKKKTLDITFRQIHTLV